MDHPSNSHRCRDMFLTDSCFWDWHEQVPNFGGRGHALSDNELLKLIHISTLLADSLYRMSLRSGMSINLILGFIFSVGHEINKGLAESLKNCSDWINGFCVGFLQVWAYLHSPGAWFECCLKVEIAAFTSQPKSVIGKQEEESTAKASFGANFYNFCLTEQCELPQCWILCRNMHKCCF